jgi:hypothetical protein
MTTVLTLLVGFGITFGLQNKLPERLYAGEGFLSRMLSCSYCTGFHAGWAAYLLCNGSEAYSAFYYYGVHPTMVLPQLLMYGFAVAGISLILDTVVQTLSLASEQLDRK